MANYKVPQDVEAEDKLLGPLSFRQFIYMVIAIMAGALAYFLGTIFIALAIIPAPFAVIFLILALPLKKDQPMEIYAAAILSFYLKPRRRIWEQDGILSMVEFTNDGFNEDHMNQPDISFDEAKERISFLSTIVDSNGEIIRSTDISDSALKQDVILEARQVEDIHDDDAGINQRFDKMISRADEERKEQIIDNLQNNQVSNTFSQPSTPIYNQVENYQVPSYTAPQPSYNNYYQQSQFNQGSITPTPNYNQLPQPDNTWTQPQSQPQIQPEAQEDTVIKTSFEQNLNKINNQFDSQLDINQPYEAMQEPEPQANSEPDQSYIFKVKSPDIVSLAGNNDLSIQTIASEAKKINERKKLLEEDEVVISLRN